MSAQPVDVLATRAQEILHETLDDGSLIDRENLAIRIARMEQRDAAVAELIEALRYSPCYCVADAETADAAICGRCRALARCGGAP